jgi:hypothetical protein
LTKEGAGSQVRKRLVTSDGMVAVDIPVKGMGSPFLYVPADRADVDPWWLYALEQKWPEDFVRGFNIYQLGLMTKAIATEVSLPCPALPSSLSKDCAVGIFRDIVTRAIERRTQRLGKEAKGNEI